MRRRGSIWVHTGIGALAATLAMATTPASAQEDPPVTTDDSADLAEDDVQGLTRGLTLPWASIVDREDALALELNPAGLARVQGAELIFTQSHFADNRDDGFGVLFALPIIDGLGVGYGLQIIDAGLDEQRYNKHTFGLASGGDIAVGVNYNVYGSNDLRALDDLTSWDLGLQLRAAPWLGIAANIRDLDSPFLTEEHVIRPSIDAGAALRFFDGRLVLESNATFRTGGDRRVEPRFLALVEPLAGLRLFGQVTTDTGPEGDTFRFVEGLVGAEFNFPYFGAGGAGVLDDVTGGYSATLRISSVAWRNPFSAPQRFYRVTLSGELPERPSIDLFGRSGGNSFLQLLQTLQAMLEDTSVEGIVLDLRTVEMGYAQLWEIRQLLEKLRDRGVKIVAYMRETGYREYYLATVAEHIVIGPSSTFNARGVLAQQSFFRGALDLVGVEPDFVKIAEYKSAPESFTRETPSVESQEALNAYLDTLYGLQIDAMAASRKLKPDALRALIDKAPIAPQAAVDGGLVDAIAYTDEFDEKLKERYGADVEVSASYGAAERDYSWGSKPTIAVIYVDGAIVTGDSGANPLLGDTLSGARTIESATRWAADNRNVVAVVLRVDSPGGSAVGSDLMYRSLTELAKKKPLIISMGDVAASGGYYVAAAGDRILCSPTTLTGSIGVYSGKFGLKKLFQLVGFHRENYERGENANIYGLEEAWTEDERKNIQDQITFLYELFLKQVSAGRKLSRDEVDSVGRGRIWSGQEAVKLKLCDEEGGLLAALKAARERAKLPDDADLNIVQIPQPSLLSPITPGLGIRVDDLLAAAGLPTSSLPADAPADQTWRALGPLRALLEPLRPAIDVALLYKDGEALAMLPFKISIK